MAVPPCALLGVAGLCVALVAARASAHPDSPAPPGATYTAHYDQYGPSLSNVNVSVRISADGASIVQLAFSTTCTVDGRTLGSDWYDAQLPVAISADGKFRIDWNANGASAQGSFQPNGMLTIFFGWDPQKYGTACPNPGQPNSQTSGAEFAIAPDGGLVTSTSATSTRATSTSTSPPPPGPAVFRDSFSKPGQTRTNTVSIGASTKKVTVTIRWKRAKDRFDLASATIVGRTASAAGKLKPGKLKITKTRGTTFVRATITKLKPGKLKIGIVAQKLSAPTTVSVTVKLG